MGQSLHATGNTISSLRARNALADCCFRCATNISFQTLTHSLQMNTRLERADGFEMRVCSPIARTPLRRALNKLPCEWPATPATRGLSASGASLELPLPRASETASVASSSPRANDPPLDSVSV